MEIIYYKQNVNYNLPPLITTIGAFDGIHIGHLELIKNLKNDEKLKTCIITFQEHPDLLLSKRENLGYLNTLDEKIEIFNELEIDYLIIMRTDKQFLNLSYSSFNNLLLSFNVKKIIVGQDFRYGYKCEGSKDTLKEFDVCLVNDIYKNDFKVSSNHIRSLLSAGQIELCNKLLFKPFCIKGVVLEGFKNGRNLGFKTINLNFNNKYSNLRLGVYKCELEYNQKLYVGVCNIGYHPSVNKLRSPLIEIHLLNFDLEIYGEIVTVYLLNFIRNEKKFESIDLLKEQIKKDIRRVEEL